VVANPTAGKFEKYFIVSTLADGIGLAKLLSERSLAVQGQAMINLTDSALNAVQSAISGADKPVGGLRIMVEAGGCAGFKYMMGLVNEAEPDDTVIERNGVKVFVDMKSHDLLAGTTIDFVVALEGSGFTFENPNATSSCSCGKSFG
jgi:iron-sulfur cluster assembly protein